MTTANSKFIQIHSLTSYPSALLNRDDAGFAKRLPFGGATRTRISSQCLKRHWRVFAGEGGFHEIDAPQSVRSRLSFERFIVDPLVAEGADEDVVRAVVSKLVSLVLGLKSKGDEIKTEQVTVLGQPELRYLAGLAKDSVEEGKGDAKAAVKHLEGLLKDKELKKNIQALNPGALEAGLGAALFGRMVTGDILTRTDSALHVAHAFTVHAQQAESDYFSAIDDLAGEDGETGSGHINASELTSGLYYGYAVIDASQLETNLGALGELAGDVVERFVRILATVSPGAKLGSTAPYSYSQFLLVEAGRRQPRTLANAFMRPVDLRPDPLSNAVKAIEKHVRDLDDMYGTHEDRTYASTAAAEGLGERQTVEQLAEWVKAKATHA